MRGFTARIAMVKVFALASLALTSQTALAVLGETEAELVKRYGKPDPAPVENVQITPADKVLSWTSRPDYKVIVVLFDGRSEREVYGLPNDIAGPDDELVQRLLELNAQGGKWDRFPDRAIGAINGCNYEKGLPDARFQWRHSDNESCAIAQKAKPNVLDVCSKIYQSKSFEEQKRRKESR